MVTLREISRIQFSIGNSRKRDNQGTAPSPRFFVEQLTIYLKRGGK